MRTTAQPGVERPDFTAADEQIVEAIWDRLGRGRLADPVASEAGHRQPSVGDRVVRPEPPGPLVPAFAAPPVESPWEPAS